MSFGRLERAQGSKPFSDINVTPLVDVMLVLLVIFIVTAPLLASSIRLDLPRTDAAQPAEPAVAITVALDAQGGLFVDEQPVDAAQLAGRLAQAAAANPDTEIQLRADRGVPYGRVVEVIGAAQQAGLNRIGFVAERP
ncbi:biopolymer transporter ExbD [Ramlibacter sp. AW1]|uniref:Biopolymer transporter ExbD n=1 Tax=Ramlibacter aurantiacus TaxID=2801330 RepID=A0A936ZJL0_9BURK|nr:biopolymer transporter ExbD [Ramlibacter aurantiacus]MBL0421393.1 biopolymer transporter ExbD [Ramlibacter aurantiacus]